MCLGYFTPAGISENVGVPQVFRFQGISATATVDEGNNGINMTYGPLTLTRPAATTSTAQEQMVSVPALGSVLGAYSIPATSAAVNAGTNQGAPRTDFFGNTRPLTAGNPADIGAVEFQQSAAAIANVTGGPLAFGSVVDGTTSASKTLVLHNTGTAALTGINIAVSAPFALAANGNSCGANLAAGANCNIAVVFQPTVPAGAATGTVTITGSVTVTGSPVALSGTGTAPVITASINPSSHGFGTATRGTTGQLEVFFVTNTGNAPLTGIGNGPLGGTNAGDWSIFAAASTCGPSSATQFFGMTTLQPGSSCMVVVQYKPLRTGPTGTQSATVSVTDAAGTQTATLTGTAR
jgi:hypothetical protein